MGRENREQIVKYKLLYTALILLVYLLGKNLPLYMIDVSAYLHHDVSGENILIQTITGDVFQCSLFALGISPYMIASMATQILTSFRSPEAKAKISPMKMNRISLVIMIIVAVLQAVLRVQNLQFRVDESMLIMTKVVAVVQMITGSMIIVWLAGRNKKYGIGGQSALIFVNIIDGIRMSVQGQDVRQLLIPLAISAVVLLIVMFMENTEIHIPVQRISVHNIYADKNYFAIKMNPIGVMPAMFSMAFFMVPQMLVALLIYIFPTNTNILWLQENLSLNKPLGVAIYIGALYFLSVFFSKIFVNPKEITEQFLKSGDSIVDVHAGKDTRKYLSRTITRISIFSATVMSVCLGVPLLLQIYGGMESAFVSLPSSVMMLTGIWCNLYREVLANRDLEAYEPFI